MIGAPRTRMRLGALLAATGGLVLFVLSIRAAGTETVFEGVRRVGPGIVLVWLLGGVRAFFRTLAWHLCLGRERRIGIASLFAAYLAGDALGNVTPFGFLISEPSKIVLVRRHIDTPAAIAALAVENLFYAATVVVMLVAGTLALLTFAAPRSVQVAGVATLTVAVSVAAVIGWIVTTRRRPVTGAVLWMIRRNIAPAYLMEKLPRIQESGDRIYRFTEERSDALIPIAALEIGYHVIAVAEIWIVVGLITGVAPTLAAAFVLEYVNRTITTVFQFVPMWLGVDEVATSAAARIIGAGSAAGVSLALVRKARNVFWTAIGLALLANGGISVRSRVTTAD